jgi:hypothetical protein
MIIKVIKRHTTIVHKILEKHKIVKTFKQNKKKKIMKIKKTKCNVRDEIQTWHLKGRHSH